MAPGYQHLPDVEPITKILKQKKKLDFFGEVAQDFLDYLDIIGFSEPFGRAKIMLSLNDLLKQIEVKGYYSFGEKKLENWKFGDQNEKLEVATLLIKSATIHRDLEDMLHDGNMEIENYIDIHIERYKDHIRGL